MGVWTAPRTKLPLFGPRGAYQSNDRPLEPVNGRTPGSTSAPWTVSRAPGRGAHRWRAPVPARASSPARLATVRSTGVPRGARAPLCEARAETPGWTLSPAPLCVSGPPEPAGVPTACRLTWPPQVGPARWFSGPRTPSAVPAPAAAAPRGLSPSSAGPPSSRGRGMTASTPCPGLTPSTARPSLGAPAAPWAPPPSSEVSVSHCVLSVPSPREELFP